MSEADVTVTVPLFDRASQLGRPLRVILLTHGGADLVLERLLELDGVRVAGVFLETDSVRRYGAREKLRRSLRYDGLVATALKCAGWAIGRRGVPVADGGDRDRLRTLAESHGVAAHFVANYHSEEAIALMRAAEPDLGVIFGTNILKESVFGVPRIGSINFHQGLAPSYRGGPPVFWELFNGETEVGLTVHFVEPRVDAGDIVLQERVPLDDDYACGLDFEAFITAFRARLAPRCARLVAEAVRMIADGTATRTAQDASLGTRYRLPIKREKDELRRRLRARRSAAVVRARRGEHARSEEV